MIEILLLACAAAVFPTLLACVIVMLTRPHAKRLLIGFLAGGWMTSMIAGILVMQAFEANEDILGSSSSLPPGADIAAGALCLFAAWLVGTDRGRARAARLNHHRPPKDPDKVPWAERALGSASVPIAFVIGAVINLPGPFYLIALEKIGTGSYSSAGKILLIVLFNLIMFTLAEVPLVGYLFRPERTEILVQRLRDFLDRNVRRIVAVIALLFGLSWVGNGIAGVIG